jgi:lipopolysaccharide export system permease protein
VKQSKSILFLYLLKDALTPILLSFFILSILVFFQQLSRNADVLLTPMLNWGSIINITINLFLPITTFTLPVAIAIGETIAISRLVLDYEWVALESNTLSKLSRLSPFIIIGFVGFLLIIGINMYLVPVSVAKLKEARSSLLQEKSISLIRPQAFISDFPNYLLRVQSVDPTTGKWSGVTILKKDTLTSEVQFLAAKSGSITPTQNNFESFEVKLSNGIYINNLLSLDNHITSAFKENTIKISLSKSVGDLLPVSSKESAQTMSLKRLIEKIKNTTVIDLPMTSMLQLVEIKLELYKRIANAFAAIFAAFTAMLFASRMRPRSSKRLPSFIGCFLLLIMFYACLTWGQNLALKGILPAHLAIFLGSAIPCFVLLSIHHLLAKGHFAKLLSLRGSSKLCTSLQEPPFNFTKYKHIATINSEASLPLLNHGHYLVVSEFTKFLFTAVVVLTLTILLFTVLDIAPSAAKSQIKSVFVAGYLAKLAPQIIYYIVPFSVLLAVIGSATALARSGQLAVLIYYASHPFRIIFPVFLLVCVISLAVFFISDSILPYTNRDQDSRYRRIKGKAIEEATFAFDRQWVTNEDSSEIYGYRFSNSEGESRLSGLAIKLTHPEFYLSEIVHLDVLTSSSNSYAVTSDKNNTKIFRYQVGLDGLARVETLSVSEAPLELLHPKLTDQSYQNASKMTLKQLRKHINQIEKTGLPTTGLRMELTQKYAFPFSCITLLILSLPICLIQLRRQHQTRLSAVLLSSGFALIFWAILNVFEAAGKRGTIPINLAAWSPHALFLALAATIHLKLNH